MWLSKTGCAYPRGEFIRHSVQKITRSPGATSRFAAANGIHETAALKPDLLFRQ